MIETVFIDLDDTLIPSHHTYHLPQIECAKIVTLALSPNCPSPADLITQTMQISAAIMDAPGPIENHHFARSWIELYQQLCMLIDTSMDTEVVTALGVEGAKWFQKEYSVYPGVIETLNKITQKKVIVTLGSQDIQQYKIENTELDKHVDAYEVVDLKNTATYISLLQKYKTNVKQAVMVGDNSKRDIIPVIDIKMKAYQVVNRFCKPFVTGVHPYYTAIQSFNEMTNYL